MHHDWRRILDADAITVASVEALLFPSTATLVRAFVASRVDHCNAAFEMSPQTVTKRR